MINEFFVNLLETMKSNVCHNYIVPGLNSSLLEKGKVRLFECLRDCDEFITPHSHRFDFACLVLQGSVANTIYVETEDIRYDSYEKFEISHQPEDKPGDYGFFEPMGCIKRYNKCITRYTQKDWYAMTANQIHSIKFSKGAKVLFFEGPTVSTVSQILQPVVNGEVIKTFTIAPWMFRLENL